MVGSARAKGWPILGHKMAILAKVKNFKFVLPIIYINFDIRFWFRPKSAILFPKRLQKLTKVAISQNPISPKCHSPKSLLLTFFNEFV